MVYAVTYGKNKEEYYKNKNEAYSRATRLVEIGFTNVKVQKIAKSKGEQPKHREILGRMG